MNYYSLQGVFFCILILIYSLLTGVSYSIKHNETTAEDRLKFQRIINEKKSLMSGVDHSDNEFFPNYSKKLSIINTTSNPFIQKLNQTLHHKKWATKLDKIEIPFADQSCLIIGKNGKQKFKKGHSMNDIFDKSWESSTFLALNNKKHMFHRLQAIYPFKISIENFQNYFQKFQITHHKNGQFVYRFYTRVKKYEVFYFLRLNEINHRELKKSIISFLSKQYSNVIPSKEDSIQWNKPIPLLTSSDSYEGLTYYSNYQSYFDYVLSLKVFNLFYMIFIVILSFYGGYRVIAHHFQFKFLTLYLFFTYILYILFIQCFTLLKSSQKEILKRSLESKYSHTLKSLEDNFLKFKNQLQDELLNEFDTQTLYTSKYWREDIYAMHSKKGESTLSRPNMDLNNLSIVTRYMPYLAGIQPEFGLKSDKITDIAQYLNIKDYNSTTVFSDLFTNNFHHETVQSGGRVFSKFSHRYFKSIPIMKDSVEVLFATTGTNQNFRSLIVKTSLDSLHSLYFKQLPKTSLQHSILIKSKRDPSKYFPLSKHIHLDSREFTGIKNRFFQQKGSLIQLQKKDQEYFAVHLSSNIFQYYDLLFISKKSHVFAKINQMQNNFDRFLCFFYLLILLSSYILTMLILTPLKNLKKGLVAVKNNDLNTKLDLHSKDESGQILQRFNSMVSELQRKEKMLPFISNAVFEILTTGSGKVETKYTGNAVVLFSDIKSFTSISETRDPQEVVDMLNDYFSIWQDKIEKNGGIVDRFIGDAISVVYFEKSSPHFIQQAIQTSVEVMEELSKVNKDRQTNGEFLIENGVGLCYGEVYFSMVGDQNKMEFLTQGTPVVLSEYLEGQSRYSKHSHIILDPYIKTAAEYQYDFAPFEVEDKSLGTFYELIL